MSESAPRVHFVISGAQKAGTTALAAYLAAHPAIRLPRHKEAHVFDTPGYDDAADSQAVDALYAAAFPRHDDAVALHGDATPIYLFHPTLVQRIARYNPAMRWIVLLRDPVERAISHWHMEYARGAERWPMFLAMLLEDWRLRGHGDDFSPASPLRTWSYRRRGDYATQLDALYAAFPREQVLVLQSRELRASPAAVVERAHQFLGIDPPAQTGAAFNPIFEGSYTAPGRLSPSRLLLRCMTRGMRHRLSARYGITFDQ